MKESNKLVSMENWSELYWTYNLPLQVFSTDDGCLKVLNYMPRKESLINLDSTVCPSDRKNFCDNTALILRNMANRFEMLGRGEVDSVYYPDEGMDD